MPDRDQIKATARELRRVAGYLDAYARTDEDHPEMLAAGASELMHLAAGLLGAEDGTAVAVNFGDAAVATG